MTTTTRPAPRRPGRARLAIVGVVVSVLLAACRGAGGPVPELDTRANDVYAVALPEGWIVVDDSEATYQVAEPDNDTPMTVRVTITDNAVESVGDEVEALRASVPSLSDNAEVLDERTRDVVGATGAVQLTSTASLNAAATGEELPIQIIDLLARASDGRVVDVKVMGPADDFDTALSDAVLSSLTFEPERG